MKTPSLELHDLIHSLSPSEKRYIRRMALDQDTAFLKLLDAIANQKVYNEAKLKVEFKKEKFVKNLAVNKKYLHDYILNSLAQLKRKEMEISILKGISEIFILQEKNLFKQVFKKIEKLKAKTDDLGLYPLSLQLLELKKWAKVVNPNETEAIYNEGKALQKKIDNLHEYWFIYNQVYRWHRRYQKEGKEDHRILLEGWLRNPLIYDFNNAFTIESKLYYYQIKAIIFSSLEKIEDAFICNWNYISLLDKNPSYRYRFSDRYLSIYHHLLVDSLVLDKYDFFEEGIRKIRSLSTSSSLKNNPFLNAKIFRQSFLLEMNALLQANKIDEGIKLLPQVENGLEKHKGKIAIHHHYHLQYLGAYFLFQKRNFKSALEWIHPLMQYHKTDILEGVMQGARLINLISNFELSTEDNINNLMKSTRRYIKQKRPLLESEKEVLAFISFTIKAKNDSQVKTQNIQLLDKLIKVRSLPKEKHFAKIFNSVKWCESRIS